MHVHAHSASIPAMFLERIQQLVSTGGRKILGLVGGPGSGKSTLAELVRAAVPNSQVVPMDGFHLANSELQRLQLRDRKGSPPTFDSAGYLALLSRLRSGHETVYAPEFRREIDESIAGAIAIEPDVQLVITEGNYLLLEQGAWAGIPALLDASWYIDIDPDLRRQRLIARHQQFGRDRQSAVQWVLQTDDRNAELVETSRHRADLVFRWT